MFRAWIVFAAACTALLNACNNGDSEVSKANLEAYANYFMPEDAADVAIAPDLPWLQRSFNVSRGPLEFAVSTEKLSRAKADGWMLCEPSNPEWTGFDDATLTPPRHTQQKAYVLYKGGVLVVLTGKYYIDVESGSAPTAKMNQHGMVIVRNGTDREAQETAGSFNLTCR